MAERFDAAVIGGGPGGYVCAIRCAQYGKKTALVERDELGGTCLNRGCVPTKALLHTAELYDEVKNHGRELGLSGFDDLAVDYGALAERKDRVLSRLRKGIEALVKARKITLIKGTAALTGPHSFSVGGASYEAAAIVLATGSEPAGIPVPGADGPAVVNSDAVLAWKQLPASVVIIGGGVIGIEFATLLSSLGRQVTIIEMLPRILNGMDEEICQAMTRLLGKRGVDIHCSARLLEIKAGSVCVYDEAGAKREAAGEAVIMAVGRRPVTKSLGLEAAGVAQVKGFVTVDEHLRTNVDGIYAVGDITGKVQLAHVASAQALTAAANIAGKNVIMDYSVIPACVYTNPEIASVGKTEAQLKEAGVPYKAGSFGAAGNARSLIMNAADGFTKILSHRETGEILGAHLMCARATDIIAEIAAAMRAEGTIEELAGTIHPHPTVSEMVMEAAHDIEGLCCHKV